MHQELDKLLPYFEREIALLRQEMLAFERDFPAAAARLAISGGQSDDPGVDRVQQSAAWTYARAAQRIDDHYPEFTEALVETVFPAYLRSVPSCSIAQFDVARLFDGRTQTFTIVRGTEFEHRPSLCQFTTAYDVTLAPIAITHARFAPSTAAPPLGVGQLASDTVGIISIGFTSPDRDLTSGSALLPDTLPLYLHTDDRLLAASLIDAILLRPQTAFVEADGNRQWRSLAKSPVSAVGFGDAEALIDESPHASPYPALRLLIEYAAFPQKFRFINLDFAAMLHAAGPCNALTLHLPVGGSATDTHAVQRLGRLTGHHVRLFCTPVVNAFKADAQPVAIKADMTAFPVIPPKSRAASSAIHSIDLVRMMQGEEGTAHGAEIPPHRAAQHWSPVGVFWRRERDRWIAEEATGCETAITLVDIDEQPVVPDAASLAISLTCTNGDLPCAIGIGAPEGDLHSETLKLEGPVTMLVRPSDPLALPRDDGSLWRLVSAFSPSHASLSPSGLAALNELKDLLYQFSAKASPDASHHVGGITGLNCVTIMPALRIEGIPVPLLVPGIRVMLSVDDTAFNGDALHTFALLMERYFMRYVGLDCMQLVLVSQRGCEIWRGEPLTGEPVLVSL